MEEGRGDKERYREIRKEYKDMYKRKKGKKEKG